MTVSRDDSGLTLVEVVVALGVTMILFLALMQTALLSISQNSKNSIRDEAISVAAERMREAENTDFVALATDTAPLPPVCDFMSARCGGNGELFDRNVRNIPGPGGDESLFDFCTCMIVPPQTTAEFKNVNVYVGWKWTGEEYSHAISRIVRR